MNLPRFTALENMLCNCRAGFPSGSCRFTNNLLAFNVLETPTAMGRSNSGAASILSTATSLSGSYPYTGVHQSLRVLAHIRKRWVGADQKRGKRRGTLTTYNIGAQARGHIYCVPEVGEKPAGYTEMERDDATSTISGPPTVRE